MAMAVASSLLKDYWLKEATAVQQGDDAQGYRVQLDFNFGAAVPASSGIANRSVRILDSSLGRLRRRGDVQVSSYIISHSLNFYMLSISLIEVTYLTGSAGQLQVWAALGESLTLHSRRHSRWAIQVVR